MRKLVKVEHGCSPHSLARVVRPHHVDYGHHLSYMCTPYLPTYVTFLSMFICFTYVKQWGGCYIHDQGSMCFERSSVSHDFSEKRCENGIYNQSGLGWYSKKCTCHMIDLCLHAVLHQWSSRYCVFLELQEYFFLTWGNRSYLSYLIWHWYFAFFYRWQLWSGHCSMWK